VVLAVLALLVPVLMLALVLVLDLYEERILRPGPPPPKEASDLPQRSPVE
jgi:hypothetical protein